MSDSIFATTDSWRAETTAFQISLLTQQSLKHACPGFIIGLAGEAKTSYGGVVAMAMADVVVIVSAAQIMPELVGGLPYADLVRKCVNLLAADFFADVAEAGPGRGVIIFDEMTDAPRSVQAACQFVFTHGRAGSLQLPERTAIVGMGNPPDVATTGGSFSEPLATRVCQIPWSGVPGEVYNAFRMEHALSLASNRSAAWPKPDIISLPKDWFRKIPETANMFAAFRNGPGRKYARNRPAANATLGGFMLGRAAPAGNPRTWEHAEYLIAAADALGEVGAPARFILLAGCVGEPAALEYLTFEKNMDLPSPQDCLEGRVKAEDFPREGHMLLALCNSVVVYACESGKSKPWHQAWDFLVQVMDETGAEDMAAKSAPFLLGHKPKGLGAFPDAALRFITILQEAGMLPKAGGR